MTQISGVLNNIEIFYRMYQNSVFYLVMSTPIDGYYLFAASTAGLIARIITHPSNVSIKKSSNDKD